MTTAQPGQEQRMDDLVPRVIAGSLTYRNGDPMQDGNTAVIKSEDLRALCDRLILYREALAALVAAIDAPRYGDDSIWDDLGGIGEEDGGPLGRARAVLSD